MRCLRRYSFLSWPVGLLLILSVSGYGSVVSPEPGEANLDDPVHARLTKATDLDHHARVPNGPVDPFLEGRKAFRDGEIEDLTLVPIEGSRSAPPEYPPVGSSPCLSELPARHRTSSAFLCVFLC